MSKFKIYSGWDERQAEAAEVFKFSVLENASIDVEVEFLKIHDMPIKRVGVTGFTYSRWLAPWINDYEGVVFACDGCDQLCLGDVAELAAMDMGGHAVRVVKHPPVLRVPRMSRARSWSSAMLMDNSKLGWLTPHVVANASDSDLMLFAHLRDEEIGDLPEAWNALCDVPGEPPEGAKLAHWSALADPNRGPWIQESGSKVWESWRQRWLASQPQQE